MATRLLKIGRQAQTTAGAVDDALLSGLRAGDPDAFEQLYLDFAGSIYNVCLRILRSPEDAEDVTQEVFIKAYKRLPGCADDFRLKAWLNRVAVNVCYDHLRSRRAQADLDTETDMLSPQHIDSFEQAELSQMLEQTLGSLSLNHRTVLLLKDVQGLTQVEIAGVLGVSNGAIAARLFRARGAFRRAYAELTQPWRRARCDLARQAAVDSVGRGLSEGQRRRVRRHAETCPDCGETVKGWGVVTVGLAVLLPQIPLPAGLLASPFAALGAGAAGAAGAGAAAGGGAAGGGIAGSSLAAAGATGAGAAGAGATGAVTGAAVTAAGALAAKVALVVIVAGALTATAGLAAQRVTAPHAHGRTTTLAASRGVAGNPVATLISEDRAAGKGHQPSAVGRPGGTHGAKAGHGTPRHGGQSPDKTSRGVSRGVGNGAAQRSRGCPRQEWPPRADRQRTPTFIPAAPRRRGSQAIRPGSRLTAVVPAATSLSSSEDPAGPPKASRSVRSVTPADDSVPEPQQ